jgi:NADPH:quinone reductase-like Zn-dependent oxidoreductase
MINLKSNSEDLRFLTELIKSGKLKTHIDKSYKLQDIKEAHRYSETKRAVGKLAVIINEDKL